MTNPNNPPDADSSGGDTVAAPITVFAQHDARVPKYAMQMLVTDAMRGAERVESYTAATIMMVDDEMLNIEMIEAFLADAGWRNFIYTDDSLQALPMMRRKPPDMLLLDLSMPNKGGLEILAELRADSHLRHIPVIVLTSTIDPGVKLQALSAGAMDFLSKPVDPSELALRIRNTLGASAYRDYLVQHDPLTGLPNKLRYRTQVVAALARAREGRHSGALVHVGVDQLGAVNDALGRQVGDQLLQRLGKRLASTVETEAGGELSSGRTSPQLFRFDGDEFAIIVPNAADGAVVAAFITKLLEDSAFGINRGGRDLFVSCCVGISVFPQDGREADELIGRAGTALRHAKTSGQGSYEFFSSRLDELAASRLSVGSDLRRAFGRDEIQLLYAPCIDVKTGDLVGADAVPQWTPAAGKPVRGDALIDLAASTDMAVALTEWVAESMQRSLLRWRSAGLRKVPVCLNLSLAHFRAGDLPLLANHLLEGGVDPQDICLALRQLAIDDKSAREENEALGRLRELGLRLSLDRFGTAQSSVSVLRRVQFDQVRLDPSFLAELQAKRGGLLLLGTLALIDQIGIPSVVCGVQTSQQVAFIKGSNARHCTGPLFGAALTEKEFVRKWMAR